MSEAFSNQEAEQIRGQEEGNSCGQEIELTCDGENEQACGYKKQTAGGGETEHGEQETYTGLQRVLALLALASFGFLLVWLVIILSRGADPGKLMTVLFLLIVVPSVLYVFTRLLHRNSSRNSAQASSGNETGSQK